MLDQASSQLLTQLAASGLPPVHELSPTEARSVRIVSQQSSLGPPLSADATRSSYMTNTSGMSRLSDFPDPPSQITASHLSILHAYYGDGSRTAPREDDVGSSEAHTRLTRESSNATFGGQHMGEAL